MFSMIFCLYTFHQSQILKHIQMALLRKLLGRKQHSLDNSKNVLQKHEEEKAVVTNTIDNTPNEINESTTSVSIQSEKKQHRRNATQRRHKKLTTEFIPFLIKDAEVSLEGFPQENPDEVSKDTCEYDSDDEDVTSSSEFEEFLVRNRHKWMEAKLRRLRTAPTPVEDDADENNNEEENQPLITMVTIETSPITPSTPEMIQSAQTTPQALLQPRTLVGQFPLPLESFI
ncbi:hypothetical protein MAR_013997 [Mya arenaria]|uniref:Uncharacterized protein n=1 Tax=Mya arenaria TaxID=6604 RepID=A0ABY7G1F1_MYAAR|nr:hypothetical protein MAR_013997 [Mya arenaria]